MNIVQIFRVEKKRYPGSLIQTAAQNRDRQVPDPDLNGNLVNPSKIREQRKQAELGVPHSKYKLGGPNQKYLCPHLLCLSPSNMSVPTYYVCPYLLCLSRCVEAHLG